MGFVTRETMSGTHEFRDGAGPAGPLPFAFRLTWGPAHLREWLDPRSDAFLWQEARGEVRVGGLCEWTPCEGTLHLQYGGLRRIRYAFDFDVGGTAYRYVGDKTNLRWWNLPITHTQCNGTIVEVASGRLVSTSVVTFKMRDLPSLLGRVRLGIGPVSA